MTGSCPHDGQNDRAIDILTGSLKQVFPPTGKLVELDLGCGKGGFTCQLAGRYPERAILAADIMLGRLRKLQRRREREKLCNISLLRVEARPLIGMHLPDRSLDRIHLLCPDPWPKTRHRHQRLFTSEFVGQLARVLKEDGSFHFATDDDQYWQSVNRIMGLSEIFIRNDSTRKDIEDIKSDFEILWEREHRQVRHAAFTLNEAVKSQKSRFPNSPWPRGVLESAL